MTQKLEVFLTRIFSLPVIKEPVHFSDVLAFDFVHVGVHS